MTTYRIIKRGEMFEVQRRELWFWWHTYGRYLFLDSAQSHIDRQYAIERPDYTVIDQRSF